MLYLHLLRVEFDVLEGGQKRDERRGDFAFHALRLLIHRDFDLVVKDVVRAVGRLPGVAHGKYRLGRQNAREDEAAEEYENAIHSSTLSGVVGVKPATGSGRFRNIERGWVSCKYRRRSFAALRMTKQGLFHPAINPSNGRSRRWIELRREFQVFRVRLERPDQRESEDEMRLLALILHSFSFTRQPELQFFNLERRNPADLLGGAQD